MESERPDELDFSNKQHLYENRTMIRMTFGEVCDFCIWIKHAPLRVDEESIYPLQNQIIDVHFICLGVPGS